MPGGMNLQIDEQDLTHFLVSAPLLCISHVNPPPPQWSLMKSVK